jgi:hypothetical protein
MEGGMRDESYIINLPWPVDFMFSHFFLALLSRQTLKQPHAPETVATRNCIGITVLFKLLGIDILARKKVAVGTEGIFVLQYLFTECPVWLFIPDFQYPLIVEVSEDLSINILFAAGKMALELVPEKVAGVDFAVP